MTRYFLLILLASIIVGSISLVYPFGRDQGIYAYIAKLILDGKVDYKFSYNLRPPAIHYTFALEQLILGKSMFNMRVFDIVWQSLTSFVIFMIAFRMTRSKLLAFVSSLIYLLLYFRLDYWHTLQTEGFMNLPFCLSIFLILSGDFKRKMYFFSGLFLSVTFLYKFVVAPYLVLLLIILFLNKKDELRVRISKASFFVFGFVTVIVFTAIYYILQNAIGQLLEVQFVQIPLYSKIAFGTESPEFVISNLLRFFFYSVYSPLILVSIVCFVLAYKNKLLRGEYLVLFVWFLSCLISVIAQWKFFLYQYLILVPPLAISAVCFLDLLYKKTDFRNRNILKYSAGFAAIVYLFFATRSYHQREADLYNFISGKQSLGDLYIKNGTTSDSVFTMKKIFAVSDYVANHTEVKDGIYIWGIEPLIYYLSGRECISRFTYNTPLCWKGANASYLNEFVSELNDANPKLILVAKRDPMYDITGFHEDSEQLLQRFPEFKALLDNNYLIKDEIQEFKIYELTKRF